MKAAEALEVAAGAGMAFAIEGNKLRVRGGSKESRAQLAPMLAPLACEIASLLRAGAALAADAAPPAATRSTLTCAAIGRRRSEPCPRCGYIHGDLAERLACLGCGRTDWVVAVVDAVGNRVCPRCLVPDDARTPRHAQTVKRGATGTTRRPGPRQVIVPRPP